MGGNSSKIEEVAPTHMQQSIQHGQQTAITDGSIEAADRDINVLLLGLAGSGKSTLSHSILKANDQTTDNIHHGIAARKIDELISEHSGNCGTDGQIKLTMIDPNGFENTKDRVREIIRLSKLMKQTKKEIDVIVICIDITARLDVDTLVDSLLLLASSVSKRKEFWQRAVIALTYSNLAKNKWQTVKSENADFGAKFAENAEAIHNRIFSKIAVSERDLRDSTYGNMIPFVCVGSTVHDDNPSIPDISKDWVLDFLELCKKISLHPGKKELWNDIILSYKLRFELRKITNSCRVKLSDAANFELQKTEP